MEYFYEYNADKRSYRYFKHKSAPYTSPHFHSAYEIILVKKGKMQASIDNKSYEISAGEGCFIDRFLPHCYRSGEEGAQTEFGDPDTEVYIFVGERSYFTDTFSVLGGVPKAKFSFRDFLPVESVARFYEEQTTEKIKDAAFKSMTALLLAAIARENDFLPVSSDVFSVTVCAALEYVETAYAEDLSLKTVAERFGYSPQHFSRLWHKHLPFHLSDYINAVRVARAKNLISGGLPVTEAVFSCGFQSMATFYRVYKKTYGVTPKQ